MKIKLLVSRVRGPREAFLHLALGLSVGYLLGFLFYFDGDNDDFKHVHLVQHGKPSEKSQIFDVRCVVILHRATVKPSKVVSAITDGYGKLCNETIFVTNNETTFKLLGKNHTIHYVDNAANHFYWSYYLYALEFSSKVPAKWTFLGDEQSYLIVPNLRRVLRNFDPESAVVLAKVRDTSNVLSSIFPFSNSKKVAVRAGAVFSNPAIDKLSRCKGFFFARSSEYALYECSQEYGVKIADPFDEDALRLFNDFPPKEIIAPDSSIFRSAPIKGGKCSDHAVTFGQLSEKDMRVIEYGMSLKVFGRGGLEPDN